MSRKASFLITGAVLGIVALFGVTQQAFFGSGAANAQFSETYRQLNLFGEVFERILSEHVEEHSEEELIQAAINGMMSVLDPNSTFLSADDWQSFNQNLSGEFGGLGIEVTMGDDGYVHVMTPIEGTPADEAGILAGDLIVGIDGKDVLGMSLDDAVSVMRGEPGSLVVISILRDGIAEPFDVELERAIIQSPQVRTAVYDGVAYVRVIAFGGATFGQFVDAIDDVVDEIGGEDEVIGFIIDLRNNSGGAVDAAVAIADAMLDGGEIVSLRGRDGREESRRSARPGEITEGKPIVVLVNGASASSSELLAGALQDLRRATLVGTTTFGKGSVQTLFPLGGDQGALKLTNYYYFTPSGRQIHGTGIEPDIFVEQPIPQSLIEAFGGELPEDEEGNPITHFNGVPRPEEDVQLQYVLDLMHGEIEDPTYPASQDEGPPA